MKKIKCGCGREVRVGDKCVSVQCSSCLQGGRELDEEAQEEQTLEPVTSITELLQAS